MARKKTKSKDDFGDYLNLIGAEKKPLTNDYERYRFIANEIVCVIYEGKRGLSFSTETAKKVYEAFCEGRRINVTGTKRKSFELSTKQVLFKRDGIKCFYTRIDLTEATASIEHLIPLSKGGKNNIDNLVLCTHESNQLMADKPLIEKLKYREEILLNEILGVKR